MKKNTFLLCIVILFNTTISFSQIGMYEIPLNQQIDKSNLIVEGKVISKKSFWDEGYIKIYTLNMVEVHKVFKGKTNPVIQVITLGGKVGDIGLTVSHHLELSENEIGVFLLSDSNLQLLGNTSGNPKYKVYSGVQGFYKSDENSYKFSNVFRSYDNIYNEFYQNIEDITKKKFIEVKERSKLSKINNNNNNKLTSFISNFSPTMANAGIGETITITGFTFGTTKGRVQFSDANNGGTSFIDALDSEIINWTDTSITVKVPSRAGTGVIRVVDAFGGGNTSSTALIVSYAILNTNGIVRQHYDTNGSGGYTWQMSSDFNNHVSKDPFLRAFETWICGTGVNWTISPSTTFVSEFARDGTNVIAFDTPGDELDAGVLAAALGWTTNCSIGIVIDEIDFVFDNERSNWHYGIENAPPGQIDFETVALHELGHGHALAHVISPGALMHFSVSSGVTNRTLDMNDLNAGNFLHNFSVNIQNCSKPVMTSIACPSLSINEEFINSIYLFPNPTKGIINIKNNSFVILQKVEVYDIKRRLMFSSKLTLSNSNFIDLNGLSKGIYFLNIHTQKGFINRKVILD